MDSRTQRLCPGRSVVVALCVAFGLVAGRAAPGDKPDAIENSVVKVFAFPGKAMLAATDELLTDNGVRNQGSPDTLAIWNAKPRK